MKGPIRSVQKHPGVFLTMLALIFIGAAGLVVLASMLGWPRQIFQFEQPTPEELPAEDDIAGWVSFDRDSYSVGETVTYRVRVLYRDELVDPDLDSFRRSVGFAPFERREVSERQRTMAEGVKEYVVEYVLQGVSVEPHSTYQLNPLVIYYSSSRTAGGELQSLRIQPPPIHISGYYPRDVSRIPLQGLKGEIRDPTRVRQALMGVSGGLILTLAILLLWRSGRKRRQVELSEPERLWQDFHELNRASLDNRAYLLSCEKIFTHLLQSGSQVSPVRFWSGTEPEDTIWRDAAARARVLFSQIYRPSMPTDEDAERITALLDEMFTSMVMEKRLQREKQPSVFSRLLQQPDVLAKSGIFVVLAALMLILAAQPALWFSPGLARYNEAVRLVKDETTRMEGTFELSDLGEQVEDGAIRAAALYNSATITANLGLSTDTEASQEELLAALFQEDHSLVMMFHELDEGQRLEILEMLSRRAESLRRAEVDLKTAVRANPYDQDIRRNLEIVIKNRKAVLDAVAEFFAYRDGQIELREGFEVGDDLLEAFIDLMKEMEMPEEYAEDAGKDDKGYHILERF